MNNFVVRLKRNRLNISSVIFLIAISSVLIFHFWKISDIPRGLYVDESSIGLNAVLISKFGVDEHGVTAPTYFKAFGEYKNPIYIYVAAGMTQLLGVSVFGLRMTSFVFFTIFLVGFLKLISDISNKNRAVIIYATIAAGFFPWFFNLSRIAFEVISFLSVSIWILVVIPYVYDKKNKYKKWYALLLGLLLGISVYTYSTSRLLSFFTILSILLVYRKRKFWQRHAIFLSSFFLTLVPLLQFVSKFPFALAIRFREVSYLYDNSLNVFEKIGLFFQHYLQYFSFNYLFISGDSIARHHPQNGGMSFLIVGVLAVVGIFWGVIFGRKSKHLQLWGLSLVCSPIAAALTRGDSSLRTITLGLYLLLFSCYAIEIILRRNTKKVQATIFVIVMSVLLFEVKGYLSYYFLEYPQISVWEFQSYDTQNAIKTALNESTSDVIVSNKGNQQYAHTQFYALTLGLDHSLIKTTQPIAQDGRCVVVSAFDTSVVNEEVYTSRTLLDQGTFVSVKCFEGKMSEKLPQNL